MGCAYAAAAKSSLEGADSQGSLTPSALCRAASGLICGIPDPLARPAGSRVRFLFSSSALTIRVGPCALKI